MVNTRYSIVTKVLMTLSIVTFVIAFSSSFFETTRASVIHSKILTFNQGAYPGLMHSNFAGSHSAIRFVQFEFDVNGITYTGWGIANNFDRHMTTIKYSRAFPQINVSSGLIWLLLSCLLYTSPSPRDS